MKIYKTLTIGILSLGVLAACGESEITKIEGEKAPAAAESNPEEKATVEKSETHNLKIGDIINIEGSQVKLLAVREIKDDIFPPSNGKYIGVELEVKNTTKAPLNLSTMLQMALRSDGYEQDLALVDTKGSLDTEIAPGSSVKGEVAFDVKASDKYEFIFEEPLKSGQAIWSFSDSEVK